MAVNRPTDQAPAMSVDAFLVWLEARPETERWELIAGEPVQAMAPTTIRHAALKDNVVAALRVSLAAADGARAPCRVIGDGPAVRAIDDDSLFQPDAVVTCARHLDDEMLIVPDPVVLVEVLSPTTRMRDQTHKMHGYFSIPSVAHYLLVEQRKRLVVHMTRGADGTIVTAFRHEGSLRLDPPGIGLAIDDIYAGMAV